MNIANTPEEKMFDAITNNDLVDRSFELANQSYSAIIESSALELLPVIRTVNGLVKVTIAVDQYLYARKILMFLAQIKDVTFKDRNKFIKKHESKSQINKTGLAILEILNKSATDQKAKIIGEVFVLHLKEAIAYEQFIRISEMINAAYTSDLDYFFKFQNRVIDETSVEVEHLLILGFYKRPKKRFGNEIREDVQPVLTKLGAVIHKAHKTTKVIQ